MDRLRRAVRHAGTGDPGVTTHTLPEGRSGCFCGSRTVTVSEKNGQFLGYCSACGSYVYNVPRHELGLGPRKPRSSSAETVDSTQRARILLRDNGVCQLCKATDRPLHVGHLLSVADWNNQYRRTPALEQVIGSDENLAMMCEECNLAIGSRTVSPILVASLHLTWLRNHAEAVHTEPVTDDTEENR